MDVTDPLAKLQLERELERDGAWLRRAAHALTSDPGIAEDAAQAAWIQAWRRRSANGRAVSRGWLKRVLWNSVRGQVRDDARRSVRERAAAVPEDYDAGDPLQRIELRRITLDAIESLEEPYRSTIVDRFLDGLSIGEIARRSGTPRKTVETRSRRGVLMLREALQGRRDSRGFALLTLLGEVARAPELTLMARVSSGVSQGLSSTGAAASVLALLAAGVLVGGGAWWTIDSSRPSPIAPLEHSPGSAQPGGGAETAQATRMPAQREQAGPDLPQVKDRAAALALVVDLDGEPVDGVEIAFVDDDKDVPPRPSGVRTDASGQARLPAPVSGKEVRLVGVAASEKLSAVLRPRLLSDHIARIVVAEQISGDVRLVNTSGEPIDGAVALAMIDTDPLERFGVGDGFEEVPRWSAVANELGDAAVSGFPRHDAIEIELSAPGYVPRTFPSNELPAVVELRRTSGAGVTGRVLDPFGAPVVGAWVGAGELLVPTGADGRYSIVHAVDSVELRAVAKGYEPVKAQRNQDDGFIELHLKDRAQTLPLVLDGPPGGAVLAVLGGEEPFGVASFEFGASTFHAQVSAEALAVGKHVERIGPAVLGGGVRRATIRGLASRPYGLSIVSVERAEVIATLEVVPTSTDVHVAGVAAGAVTSLAGMVISEDNRPVHGAEVRVAPLDLEVPRSLLRRELTDERGEFRFDGLGGAGWTLLVMAEPDAAVSATLRVESAPSGSPFKIVLPSRRRARLHFSDPSLRAARLTLLDRNENTVAIISRLGRSTVRCQSLTLGDGRTGVLEFPSLAFWALLETQESSVKMQLPAPNGETEGSVEVILLD